MSLPDNVRSTQPITGEFVLPDDRSRDSPLIDYELGGIAMQDASQGLRYQVWKCSYSGGSVIATPESVGGAVVLFAETGITELSMSFDQNMNHAVAYMKGGECYLNWYDAQAEQQVTTNWGNTFLGPRLTHDDKRRVMFSLSDVLFFYWKGSGIYWRQQRDRYEVERLFANVTGTYRRMNRVGMNVHNRVQVELS